MTLYIADSAVFINGYHKENSQFITVPAVGEELKSREARMRFDLACERGTRSEIPDPLIRAEVIGTARHTQDAEELSATDIDILAKALEYKEDAVLLTDDYAVQNVAAVMGINVAPISQKKIKDVLVWGKRCTGCRRKFDEGDVCPVCGSKLKKTRKRKL
ncbi:MAG: NOB1 family endonuclease [Methanosarcinaceae archaeon]|nr:NOB1 family endonuclease [Methanosarcinaceae archaeon]